MFTRMCGLRTFRDALIRTLLRMGLRLQRIGTRSSEHICLQDLQWGEVSRLTVV
jgi:hypothetical protein